MGRSNSSTRSAHRSFVTGRASNATRAIYRPDREKTQNRIYSGPGVAALIDWRPAGADHGIDVDEHGDGMIAEPRLYQLIGQRVM